MSPELLHRVFGYLCGQVNVWALDGTVLPMCQRCTGLYVGGVYAAVVIAIFRVKPNALVLWAHGIAMLFMIPFGYHFVPHGPVAHTVTGQLFAYGLVYFLFLNLADRWGWWRERNVRLELTYATAIVAGIAFLLLAVIRGGHNVAAVLSLLGALGALTYLFLVLANLVLFALFGCERWREWKAV